MTENFTIICPPPNVTGELHLGHALVIAVQNFFIYCYRILGKTSFILPGYDHGGIGTQTMAMKQNNIDIKDEKLFEKVQEFAQECKKAISNQLSVLNLQADYKYEKYTFDKSHTDFVQESFIKLYEMGYISRKKMIVNFDTSLGTSISDLEVNYEERNSKLYFIKYEIEENKYIEVATSRPETIFADCALIVNPEDQRYHGLSKAKIPLIDKEIPILRDSYVDMSFGSGVLKVTPAHDINDWKLAKKHNLEAINIIKTDGTMDLPFSSLNNLSILEARKKIIEDLKYRSEVIKQKIPVNRSNGFIIEYILQEQWFLDMKHAANLALGNFPQIEPYIWKDNYISWLTNIEPWCLSRNIVWGHRIPVWYDHNNNYKVCIENPGFGWKKTEETLDTWFSSALWPLSYKQTFGIYPTDLLVTAYDILFFWVARMIMLSLLLDNSLPFKQVYIHQLVRDSKGLKMSKTKGNVLNPINEIEKHGLDEINFAFLSMLSPNSKIRFGKEVLYESKKIITKIKSLYHYFKIRKEKKKENFKLVDDYFKSKLAQLENSFKTNLYSLQIHLIKQQVIDFLYEICDWLIEIDKIFETSALEIFNLFKKLLFPFFPTLIEELGVETNWGSYEAGENEQFLSLKKLITKIRYLKKAGVDVKIKSSGNSDFVCLICNIEEYKSANFSYGGEMLFLSNFSPLKKEIQNLEKKLEKLDRFFTSDKNKIDKEILDQKTKEKDEILFEMRNLGAIVHE